MQIKYCLPIIINTQDGVSSAIKKNFEQFSYFEIWLDYIEELDNRFIEDLSGEYKEKLLFLFRRRNLETPKMSPARRQEIIELIEPTKSYIDLDIFDQKEELQLLSSKKLTPHLICSYHNYTATPSENELNLIFNAMKVYRPDIFKFAAYCKEEADALTLLSFLLRLNKSGVRYIVSGMGEKGVISRFFGAAWGNEMVFAPISTENASADGQITRDAYEKIFSLLKS